ncbi:11095_t:CDS:2, partial [Funneliformis geosporum]
KAEILPSVNYIQREVASNQINMELDVEFKEIEEPEILPDTNSSKEAISDTEPELKIISIKEAAQ